jgi:4-amino-4-deoxy-L-arabinose transferase-like glycosyltransferase
MSPDQAHTNPRPLRDVLILTVVIGVFFAFMLGNRALSVPDEGRYVEIPREMVSTGDYLTPRLNGVKYFEKPVLFYWLESFSIRLFGLREFFLRLWPLLFALFGCLLVYAAGRRLYGRRSGLIAATVLATSLLYYGLGRAIILDMPVSVLLAAALLSFLLGMHEVPGPRRRLFLWSFYVFSALAVLTKGLIGMLIPGMVIGAWIMILGEWRVLKTMYLPTGLALFLLIAAPWHLMVERANPEFFHFYFIQEHFLRYLTTMHSRYQPPWFFVPVVLLGLFPWSVFLVQAIKHNLPSTWRERHEHRDALFLILWAGLVFLFFSASDSKLVPYILPVFPPLALLIGRYLGDAWDSREFPGVRAGYALLLTTQVILGGAVIALPHFWHTPDVQALGWYPVAAGCTLMIGAVLTAALARFRGFRFAFITVAVIAALFLIELNAAAPRIDTKSVKTLAMTLKPLLKPGDEVASYLTYYQDLPVYLERRIITVDWKGELDFGTTVEDTRAWMMDSAAFWKRWAGPETIYLLMDVKIYEAMRSSNPRVKLYPVAQNQRNIVISNRKVKQ